MAAYTNIDDPSAYFQAKVYTGSNSNKSITNDGNSDLQPDFIFASYRTLPPYTNHRAIIDSSRGRAKILESDTNAAEATTTLPAYDLVSFDTNGFTVGNVNSTSALNASGISHVAWQWKANGGTTSSNTDGSTTTTVQVNQDAGFSIVTYTGTGAGGTMGHGLGVTPDIVLTKARSGTSNWSFNSNLSPMTYGTNKLLLNSTAGVTADNNEVTAASSTTFTGGGSNAVNGNGSTYVAYCFASKQGYSKFGSYYGNGSTDGKFVYLGFKPAMVIFKVLSDPNHGWSIMDNKRSPFNLMNDNLFANSDAAETTDQNKCDFLSNGFKLRGSTYPANAGGTNTFFYFAFAENPFVTSTGVPTTAR